MTAYKGLLTDRAAILACSDLRVELCAKQIAWLTPRPPRDLRYLEFFRGFVVLFPGLGVWIPHTEMEGLVLEGGGR